MKKKSKSLWKVKKVKKSRSNMAAKKKKKKENGETDKVTYNIDQKVLLEAKKKLMRGKEINPEEFQQILVAVAKDFREKATDTEKTALEYVSTKVGASQTSLNSYYFMSFQIMNKDMDSKVHPYVAFTNAMIHALNLGYCLGKLDFDDGPTTTKNTAKVKRGGDRGKLKKTRGKK